jgi:hypothetical protein
MRTCFIRTVTITTNRSREAGEERHMPTMTRYRRLLDHVGVAAILAVCILWAWHATTLAQPWGPGPSASASRAASASELSAPPPLAQARPADLAAIAGVYPAEGWSACRDRAVGEACSYGAAEKGHSGICARSSGLDRLFCFRAPEPARQPKYLATVRDVAATAQRSVGGAAQDQVLDARPQR